MDRKNRKMVCWVLITVIGLAFSMFCLLYAAMNPCIYNGDGGVLGALLAGGILGFFVVSGSTMCIGLMLCFIEAYRKD